ncbi:hypothetical protein D1159_18920 [Pseudoflavonifractor sp. 524-17]|uniref:group II intron reverse transcriptase/maturase n=1 Tax=Pseudoflavonifractor sp. 524-17 TaxID=2304577 RepID=UPI00137A5AC1|nr:group II intron reverse transcriptase/maturase [Pseudoflavonifractor sp. 524-17]NCE66565.1 hypothetical protein [Pseudoflavonifractor sp. 524-17]
MVTLTVFKTDSSEYTSARYQAYKFRDAGKAIWDELSRNECKERAKGLKELQKIQRSLPSRLPKGNGFKSIQYARYANGTERFKALHRGKLTNKTDIEILSAFNSEIRGLYNFYSIANDAWKIGRFSNIMKYTMLKIFANKYRTTVHQIKV